MEDLVNDHVINVDAYCVIMAFFKLGMRNVSLLPFNGRIPDSSGSWWAPCSTLDSIVLSLLCYMFEPTELTEALAGELAFEKDDIIKVVDRRYKSWWWSQLKVSKGIWLIKYSCSASFVPVFIFWLVHFPADLVSFKLNGTFVWARAIFDLMMKKV